MSEIYYTLIHKTHHCPMWHVDVNIEAKYRFYDENSPFIAKYVTCYCPIVKNLRLPLHKQDKKYELFRYCRKQQECLNSLNFEPIIDVSK